MDNISPEVTVRVLHKHRYVEPWMSHGIEMAAHRKLEL